jgi:hypothetical protein
LNVLNPQPAAEAEMKYLLMIAVASFFALSNVSASRAVAPEYKACHGGNAAACKRWRDRSCKDDANPAACDYDEGQKQKDPLAWCLKRYEDNPAAYRWCVSGSPDR